ncbi:uncharacterized protein LOC143451697 [Clavelina lepadiformis]|uniref:uncharacterized protein LOC143451697 n=1 Tax=Clavelina lepadiformis TaxID=159417 RepID=UPI0040426979
MPKARRLFACSCMPSCCGMRRKSKVYKEECEDDDLGMYSVETFTELSETHTSLQTVISLDLHEPPTTCPGDETGVVAPVEANVIQRFKAASFESGEEAVNKTVRFDSNAGDAAQGDFIKMGNRAYRKTPLKQTTQSTLTDFDNFVCSFVGSVITSGISYYLATCSIHRGLQATISVAASDKSSDSDTVIGSESEMSEDEAVSDYVDHLLESVTSICSIAGSEVFEIQCSTAPSVEIESDEIAVVLQQSLIGNENPSDGPVTPPDDLDLSSSETSVSTEELSPSPSLEWDNYDLNLVQLEGIVTPVD